MLTIDVSSLDPGVHYKELTPDPEDVDLDPDQFSDLYIGARLDCQPDRILAQLEVEGTAQLTCDRTLQPFDQPLQGSYGVLFAPPSVSGSDEDERYEEVREFEPHDRELDVTDVVRDTLLLAIPQRQIAPGAEEEEIKMEYGASETAEEDAIDPRWAPLRELRDDDDES